MLYEIQAWLIVANLNSKVETTQGFCWAYRLVVELQVQNMRNEKGNEQAVHFSPSHSWNFQTHSQSTSGAVTALSVDLACNEMLDSSQSFRASIALSLDQADQGPSLISNNWRFIKHSYSQTNLECWYLVQRQNDIFERFCII